jgi:hypothetical protein
VQDAAPTPVQQGGIVAIHTVRLEDLVNLAERVIVEAPRFRPMMTIRISIIRSWTT